MRHFFSGLVVRVRQAFQDAEGRSVPGGQVLHLMTVIHSESTHALTAMERTVRLNAGTAIAQNAGNGWFQPVPIQECLEDLWELVEDRLCAAEALAEEDEVFEPIREDVEEIQAWLSSEDDRGPVPDYTSAQAVAQVFGPDSEMAAWLPLLFAGMSALSAA